MISPVMIWRRKELYEYFSQHERFVAPIFGNLLTAGFLNLPNRLRCGDYYTMRQDGKLYGVAALFNDGNMMVHCMTSWTLEVYNLTTAFPWHTLWDYSFQPGVGDQLRTIPGVDELRSLILMERDPSVPLPARSPDIEVIRAERRPSDPEIIAFIKDCMQQCFHFDPDLRAIRKRLSERTHEERYLVAIKDGVMVSQAHIQSWTPRYGVIGGVGSLYAYRGQGLAKAVTARLCSYIEETGRTPILTVDHGNEPALSVYRSLGFVEVDRTFACHRRS